MVLGLVFRGFIVARFARVAQARLPPYNTPLGAQGAYLGNTAHRFCGYEAKATRQARQASRRGVASPKAHYSQTRQESITQISTPPRFAQRTKA